MTIRPATTQQSGLANTLFRVPRTEGVVPLQRRGDAGGAQRLSSWRVRLAAGNDASISAVLADNEEAVLVLQQGAARFTSGTEHFDAERAGVFAGPASAVFLPPGATLTAHATRDFEAILIATPVEPVTDARRAPVWIGPDAIAVHDRGEGGYQRHVHDILVNDPHAQTLLVGETFNPPGHWSSYPPHKHDGVDGEPALEEVYHYSIDPARGFGQQLLYTADGESVAHTVRDGDAVLLPYGYHPVAAPPGYQLYYLWALAGDERRLVVFEDPDHRWLHDAG